MHFKMIQKTITLIEADESFQATVSNIIQASNEFLVAKIYTNLELAFKRLLRDQPLLIVMDLTDQQGIDFILKVKEEAHWVKILILTSNEDNQIAFHAINQGVSGYLYKKNCERDLLEALHCISNGGSPIDPFVAAHVIRSIQINRASPLSNRETTILKHMIKGKTSTGIANDLIISHQTVRTHVKNIYKKLKVNSREQALKKAIDNRWIVGYLGLAFQ
jgi:DNA-binding NarL/FixJ family response regulator